MEAEKTLAWQLGSNMMDPNAFSCSVSCSDDYAVAIDESSSGEMAISRKPSESWSLL